MVTDLYMKRCAPNKKTDVNSQQNLVDTVRTTAAKKRLLPPPTFIQVCQDPNEGAYNPKIKPPSCPLLLIPDITSNLTKCHLQSEMTSMESVKTVHLKAASCLAQVCSPLSEMSKVPTHDTRGNSSCITPAPADLSWWRWARGGEDDGIAMSSNPGKSPVYLLQELAERTSQLLMSRCKSVIWGLLDRPRNRALKENTIPGSREKKEAQKWAEFKEITMETSVLLKSNGWLLMANLLLYTRLWTEGKGLVHVSALLEAAAVLNTNLKLMHGEAVMTGQAVTIPLRQLWLTSIIPDTAASVAGRFLCLHRHRLYFGGLTAGYRTSKKLVYYRNVLFLPEG